MAIAGLPGPGGARPGYTASVLAISRFRVPADREPAFVGRARAASAFFRTRPGCEGVDVVKNLDDPELWAIVTRWANVGSYRRSFNGFEAKMVLVPLLSEAIDEPSAYDDPEHAGTNLPRDRDRD